jgi:polyhydroxyalkanoate synthesis regulator phasin
VVDDLISIIEELVDSGDLTGGQGNALVVKLENALEKLGDGKTNTAINQLGAFINQVEALVNAGTLTPEEGEALIEAAQFIIDQLSA